MQANRRVPTFRERGEFPFLFVFRLPLSVSISTARISPANLALLEQLSRQRRTLRSEIEARTDPSSLSRVRVSLPRSSKLSFVFLIQLSINHHTRLHFFANNTMSLANASTLLLGGIPSHKDLVPSCIFTVFVGPSPSPGSNTIADPLSYLLSVRCPLLRLALPHLPQRVAFDAYDPTWALHHRPDRHTRDPSAHVGRENIRRRVLQSVLTRSLARGETRSPSLLQLADPSFVFGPHLPPPSSVAEIILITVGFVLLIEPVISCFGSQIYDFAPPPPSRFAKLLGNAPPVAQNPNTHWLGSVAKILKFALLGIMITGALSKFENASRICSRMGTDSALFPFSSQSEATSTKRSTIPLEAQRAA